MVIKPLAGRAAPTRAKAKPGAGERGGEVRDDGDQDALAAVDRGDVRAAVALLMQRHGASIYRFCRQMVGDDTLADDVHQQVFVQVFRDLGSFRRRSAVRTWLYGIARHRCLDAVKIEGRRGRRFPLDGELGRDSPDLDRSALDKIGDDQLAAALTLCLEELGPAARTAVLLRYREGFRYEEMSEVCGDKPGTLQQRVARALPVLRKCLERRLGDGEDS